VKKIMGTNSSSSPLYFQSPSLHKHSSFERNEPTSLAAICELITANIWGKRPTATERSKKNDVFWWINNLGGAFLHLIFLFWISIILANQSGQIQLKDERK
jgi:hypothetical protein